MTTATHRQVLAFLWRYLREHKPVLLIMFVMMLSAVIVGLIQPFFYKEAVDAIATAESADDKTLRFVVRMILAGIAFALSNVLLFEGATYFLAKLSARVMVDAHSDVFAHVQKLSTHFHVNTFAGSTTRKITRGTGAIENVIDIFWFNFLPLVLGLLGFMVVLSFFAPVIGVAIVVSMLIYIPIAVGQNIYLMKYTRWQDRQDTRITASVVDTITGNATVKAFSAHAREDDRHADVTEEWRKRAVKTWHISTFTGWCQSSLMIVIECALLLLAVWLWYTGQFTPGGFIVVIFYVGRLWGFMRDIGRQVRQYLQNIAHMEEMVGLYLTPLCIDDHDNAASLEVTHGEIAFNNVTFSYEDKERTIFKDFSTVIKPGEKVALVGHSGGGKSTFVKLLMRLYDLDAGSITIDSQDIASVSQESLRRSIGLMPQDPLLFHRTIAENISYGRPDASLEDVERVARLAHAHEFIKNLPLGYDTLVGERGVKLSGGERQRVAIARAILADTPILVLDEATSSLDSVSEGYIQKAIEELLKDRTAIVIAHRLSTIKKVDRILVIEDGTIVEEGSHEELLQKDGGVYRGFYELQAGGFLGE